MNERNPFESTKRTPLDKQLDAALAKYSSVEPRAGLEQRILANLKAQEVPRSHLSWWRWAIPLAGAFLVISFFIWKVQRHRPEQVVGRPTTAGQQVKVATNSTVQVADHPRAGKTPIRTKRHKPTAISVAPTAPKLEQFPSPRPLTEQEKLLAEYVSQFHEEAVLVARARAEIRRKDLEETQHGTNNEDEDLQRNK
jgi:hypothetical protein